MPKLRNRKKENIVTSIVSNKRKPASKKSVRPLRKIPRLKGGKDGRSNNNYFSHSPPRISGDKDKSKLTVDELVKKAANTDTDDLAEDIILYNTKTPRSSFARWAMDITVNEFLSRVDCEDYYDRLQRNFLRNGIRHPDVLHFYIRAFLGFNIPRKKICVDHVSPFAFISDMFFEQVRNSIAFANRNGGKTLNIAILNHLDMAFKSHCEICSAGSTIAQSGRMYKYFTGFHNNNEYLAELLYKDPTKSESVYKNGSNIETITGSVKGLNSPHPQKARIDEVELMDWQVLQQGLSMAKSGKGIMAQMAFSCITEDTILWPFNSENNLYKKYNYTVKDLLKDNNNTLLYVYDIEKEILTYDKVKRVWCTKTDIVYKVNYTIFFNGFDDKQYSYNLYFKSTIDHLILLDDGITWKQVGELKTGDKLKGFTLKIAESDIVSVFNKLEYAGIENVYDIEMNKHHNFIANGLVLHNSTRKEEYGTMQRLLNRARQDKRVRGGFKIYKWCIWEILEKCDRHCTNDPTYGLCPIMDMCRGRAKKCTGFYLIDDFIDKVQLLDEDTLNTEWFNKKPSTEMYVYGKYWQGDIEKQPCHILPVYRSKNYTYPEYLLKNKEIEKIASIDFGSSPGHPFVYKLYFCDVARFKREVEVADDDDVIVSKITFYCVYEYRNSQATTAERAAKIKMSPYWNPQIPIFADPSARMERVNLEGQGVYTYAADNELLAGIETVRSHLQFRGGKANLYYIEGYYDCNEEILEDSTEEYKKYKYRRTKDGQVNRKEPLPTHDHGLDCDRYAINSANYYFREVFNSFTEEVEGGFWG